MFAPRLLLASLAITSIVAEVLSDSKQAIKSSEMEHEAAFSEPGHEEGHAEPAHEEVPVHDEGPAAPAHEVPQVHDEGPAEPVHADARRTQQQLEDTKEQQLESSSQIEHNAALKMTDGVAEAEPVDIDRIDEVPVPQEAQSSVEVAFDGSEVARRSPVHEDSVEKPQMQATSTTEILVQPSGAMSMEQPQTQTKSTTEILVQASGEVLAQSPETPLPTKQRAGTNARRVASAVDAGEHHSLPYAQNIAGSVLRQEKETPAAGVLEHASPVLRTETGSTASQDTTTKKETTSIATKADVLSASEQASPVLRTEAASTASTVDVAGASAHASPVLRTEQGATTSPVVATEKEQTSVPTKAEVKEIRLSAVSQPVVSRSHRIPTSRPHLNNNAATSTTTAAAISVTEPEALSWKHGLIPGILAHLQVEEGIIIQVTMVVFLTIIACGICAKNYSSFAKSSEAPETTGPSRGSMFSGLSSVDFVDGEDQGVRSMLRKIWDARKGAPRAEAPTYPGGVATPTPIVIAQGQPQCGVAPSRMARLFSKIDAQIEEFRETETEWH